MISHLLHYSNSSVLPHVSCNKHLSINGFSFEYDAKQLMTTMTLFFDNSYLSKDLSSFLLFNPSEGRSSEVSSLDISSRFILDSFNAVSLEMSDSIGTNFLELIPLCNIEHSLQYTLALPTYIYFEVIPNNVEYQNARNFVLASLQQSNILNTYNGPTKVLYPLHSLASREQSYVNTYYYETEQVQPNHPQQLYDMINTNVMHIVFVAGGAFDGQKQIMMSPWKHFINTTQSKVKFTLIWVCSEHLNAVNGVCESIDTTVRDILRSIPIVDVIYFPVFRVSPEAFDEKADDEAVSLKQRCQLSGVTVTGEAIQEYAIQRLRYAARNIENVSPDWVRAIWRIHIEALVALQNVDVLVVGNTGTLADAMIPEALLARQNKSHYLMSIVLDIAATISLPHPLFHFDVVLAPSSYAQRYFANLIHSQSQLESVSEHRKNLQWFIAQPGVDVERLQSLYHIAKESIHNNNIIITCQNDSTECIPVTPVEGGSRGVSTAVVTIGFVGRLVPMKAPGVFLLVAQIISKIFPSTKFVMIGTGNTPYVDSLKRLARRLGVDGAVEFTGKISQDELPSQLARLDILLNPSISANETFCVVNIEAMAVGLPIVSHGTYGQGEYFIDFNALSNEGNSMIAATPSVHSLADAVIQLIRNETMRLAIGKNAQALIFERFSSVQAAARYISAMRHAHSLRQQQ